MRDLQAMLALCLRALNSTLARPAAGLSKPSKGRSAGALSEAAERGALTILGAAFRRCRTSGLALPRFHRPWTVGWSLGDAAGILLTAATWLTGDRRTHAAGDDESAVPC